MFRLYNLLQTVLSAQKGVNYMKDDPRDDLIQNLEDAGCSHKVVEEFLSCGGEKKAQDQLKVLSNHRKKLLDNVHKCEKQIGCLDYLVYKLQKDKENNDDKGSKR